MVGFKIPKGDTPIYLIGGGPSLKETIKEIKALDRAITVACGSVHDYLIQNGVYPTYCVVCDPDPISALYLKENSNQTIYLIATQCDDAVFDALVDKPIFMWHCYNEEFEKFVEIEVDFQAIGGGCTVGMRALSIAIMMGYHNIHFYGFDSCLGDDKSHHAYGFNSEEEELGKVFTVSLDPLGVNKYYAAGYQLAQVQHFQSFYCHYIDFFTPTFHGTGLLPAMMDRMAEAIKQDKLQKDKANGS